MSEQIRPWDTLACCWDVKQATNKQIPLRHCLHLSRLSTDFIQMSQLCVFPARDFTHSVLHAQCLVGDSWALGYFNPLVFYPPGTSLCLPAGWGELICSVTSQISGMKKHTMCKKDTLGVCTEPGLARPNVLCRARLVYCTRQIHGAACFAAQMFPALLRLCCVVYFGAQQILRICVPICQCPANGGGLRGVGREGGGGLALFVCVCVSMFV